jgi:dolichol kinase
VFSKEVKGVIFNRVQKKGSRLTDTHTDSQNALPVERKPFQGFRKVFHVLASSTFPLFYLYPPANWFHAPTRVVLLWFSTGCFFASLLLDLFRLANRRFNSQFMARYAFLIRKSEANRLNGSTFLLLAFSVVIYFFSRPVAITAMLFLSLGDAAAELGGKNFGRLKIFERSLEGSLSFFFVSFAVAFALLEDVRVAVLGALAGTLVELFSFEWDDNLTVPIGSAVALSGALVLFHFSSQLLAF